jgi:acetoacetyl-CoA synthetase
MNTPLMHGLVRPARITAYTDWLARERGLQFDSYDALWRWSVTDLAAFWQSVWDFFDIESPTPHRAVLEDAAMPGARWFPGAQLNYARQALRHADAAHAAGHPAIVFQNERMASPVEVSWPELKRQVGAFAAQLQAAGVEPGDRVCAYLPNTPHTVVAFLACASVGAIWSVCSPDMGPVAVLDRFRQIAPKVLVAVDGQVWGGVVHDRRPVLREVLGQLPSVQHLVLHREQHLVPRADVDSSAHAADFARDGLATHDFADWTAGDAGDLGHWQPRWLPFDHPLWVVYSSGTTGLPKPLVHGHGGVLLEALKGGALHNDIAPSVGTGERFHWFSSTGWIMWNGQVSGLLGGTTICIYDGNPGGPAGASDWGTLWRFAARAGVTWFGAGAAFFASCLKAGVVPQQEGDLSRLHAIGSTGSPLSEDCYQWIWDQMPLVNGQRIWINPISGGTDFAGAFVAGVRTLPVVKGEMQARCLGAAVAAYSEDGRELIDEVGELVCTQPMPSMPLFFWNDAGHRRYIDSYFDMFPATSQRPAVWRHGDWIRITPHPESGASGAIIYGRSDATINRHGVRMGTSELYRAVEALPEVLDSLVVDLEYLGRESWMPLFVVLREGLVLDPALQQRLRGAIKQALSPRHVPSEIFQVSAIPRTLSGKKMELPVKKLLMGADAAQVMNRDAMANASSVDWFVALARQRQAAQGAP